MLKCYIDKTICEMSRSQDEFSELNAIPACIDLIPACYIVRSLVGIQSGWL